MTELEKQLLDAAKEALEAGSDGDWQSARKALSAAIATAEAAQPYAPVIEYANNHPWALVSTPDGQESISVSIGRLSFDEDGRAYVFAFVGDCERRMYLDGRG